MELSNDESEHNERKPMPSKWPTLKDVAEAKNDQVVEWIETLPLAKTPEQRAITEALVARSDYNPTWATREVWGG